MNYINLSTGEKITRRLFDSRIRKAKEEKLKQFLEIWGYYFCEECFSNECKPIDNSHDISVKECIEKGTPELAYDINNITLRGRECHNKHDTNQIKWTKKV